MGSMVEGIWQVHPIGGGKDGRFARKDSGFRNWVTASGEAGPSGEGGFAAQPGRYRLYVSLACPWASRATIMRRFKGLEDIVPLSVVNWHMGDQGWTFEPGPCVTDDPVMGARFLHQLYAAANPGYTGSVTVPVLWDEQTGAIVSNESADIIRMFDSGFDAVGAKPGSYYPDALRGDINAVNERIYGSLNNGVYKAGFAQSQEAYEEAVGPLFATLDWLEQRLADTDHLVGGVVTEADIRLFTTLIRFDAVYHGHFKCNVRRIADYPALSRYTKTFYRLDGVAETVDFDHIKRHYYGSHRQINPTGIVPAGPDLASVIGAS